MDQELREYLQGEFAEIGEQMGAMNRRIDELRDELRGEIRQTKDDLHGEIRQTKDDLHGEIRQTKDDLRGEIRQAHVLIEQNRDEIRTVAEGVANNGERIDRLREESQRERHEIRDELLGHLRSSHQGLDRRVSRLEEAVADSPRRMPRL